jgi:hypothetical protein
MIEMPAKIQEKDKEKKILKDKPKVGRRFAL